uniref:BTB domain-containing protein n=1 Tax=Panagrellus redivivus TaxID=6233 RepID=A0A7E4W6T7_PANRE
MDNLKTKTTLKDVAILTIHKALNGQHLAYQYDCKSRIFPGSDKYQWCFCYSPAEDASSDEAEQNHVRLCLNFESAVKGRFTVEAKGLPTQTYEFPILNNYEWFYASHDDVLAVIDDVLELKCTVEIEADVIPEIEHTSEKHSYQNENRVEDSSSGFEVQQPQENEEESTDVNESALDFDVKIKKDAVSETPSVDDTSVSASSSTGQQSTAPTYTLNAKKPIEDVMYIPLRKSSYYDNAFWNPITTGRVLHHGSNEYNWSITYNHDKDLCHYINEIIIEFCSKGKVVDAKVIVEAKGIQTMTFPITTSGIFTFTHLPYQDVFNAVHGTLQLKCTLIINGGPDKHMDQRQYLTKLYEFNDRHIPTDFEVHCGDDHYKVHKEGLIQLSPVFKAMIEHNDTESSSNMIEINDFDFKAVETTLNCCYWRTCGKISVETAVNVLRFAEKYIITDDFSPIEEMLERNLSATNFCTVLHCAIDCDKPDLFTKCANFYKSNEDAIKTTEFFLALPTTLLIKLLKSAFNFEVEFDVFLHARKNGIHLDMVNGDATLAETETDTEKAVCTYEL